MGGEAKAGASARPVPSRNSSSPEKLGQAGAAWKPTYIRRLPLLGLACLSGVVLCTAGAAAVLVASNHVSSSKWHQDIAPNVCLALINSVSNIMLAVAISYGVALAWWRKVRLYNPMNDSQTDANARR